MSDAHRRYIGEIFALETADNKILTLSGQFGLQAFSNFGAIPPAWVTREGYKQVGSTVLGYNLGSRSITLQITGVPQESRTKFWAERLRLIDFLRPNRGANNLNEITLRLIREDGSRRRIYAYYQSGLEFGGGETEDNFLTQGAINLICFNPIWYDDNETVNSPDADVDQELVFPIDFPISFGTSGANFNTGDLDYQGTWRSYPTIIVNGPYSTLTVVNTNTLAGITLLTAIASDELRIITLSESGWTIVDGFGTDKSTELGVDSDMIGMAILPASQLPSPDAPQALTASLLNGSEDVSTVTISYRSAYYGI